MCSPRGDVLVGALRLRQRVHAADHDLELPGGDRPQQLGDPLAKLAAGGGTGA